MNHSIVVQMKSNDQNRENVLLPVAEMLTTNQTSLNIEIFLIKIIASIKRLTTVHTNIANYIVIDCSFAEMNAIAKSNGLTLEKYLKELFMAYEKKDMKSIDGLCLIAWCSSHFTKIVVKDVKKNYPGKGNNNIRGVVVEIIMEMMSCESFSDLDFYIKQMLVLFKKKYMDDELKLTHQKFSSYFHNRKNDDLDNDDSDMKDDFEVEEFRVLYKSSPFYQLYSTFFNQIKDSVHPSAEVNRFYNVDFGLQVLKKYVAYLPLFAGPFMKLDHFKARPNNGAIERFFGLEKKDNKDRHFGTRKPERVGRFIWHRMEKMEVLRRRMQLQLKTSHSKVTVPTLEDSQDNWKNKNSTAYHSQERVRKEFTLQSEQSSSKNSQNQRKARKSKQF
jgi:hypothetical protein